MPETNVGTIPAEEAQSAIIAIRDKWLAGAALAGWTGKGGIGSGPQVLLESEPPITLHTPFRLRHLPKVKAPKKDPLGGANQVTLSVGKGQDPLVYLRSDGDIIVHRGTVADGKALIELALKAQIQR